jgi:hypothetical protein
LGAGGTQFDQSCDKIGLEKKWIKLFQLSQ